MKKNISCPVKHTLFGHYVRARGLNEKVRRMEDAAAGKLIRALNHEHIEKRRQRTVRIDNWLYCVTVGDGSGGLYEALYTLHAYWRKGSWRNQLIAQCRLHCRLTDRLQSLDCYIQHSPTLNFSRTSSCSLTDNFFMPSLLDFLSIPTT